jgi:hypothetical protein
MEQGLSEKAALVYLLNRLIGKFIFEDAVDRSETIFPAYLLTFFIGSAIVGNPNLIDPYFRDFRKFCRDFRFNSETFFFDCDLFCDRNPYQLIARFHIRKIKIRHHVRDIGQEFISDGMPIE